MFYFKHGSHMFFRNIVLSFILILQIAASIFLIGITASRVDSIKSGIAVFSDIRNDKGFYVMPAAELQARRGDEYYYDKVSNIDGVREIVNSYQCFGSMQNTEVRFMCYDDYIIENCRLPLSRGKWFSDYSGEAVPVIIDAERSSLKVGQTVSIDDTKYEIIGVLSQSSKMYISFDNGGNEIDITELILNYDRTEPLFICPSSCCDEALLKSGLADTYFLALFDSNASDAQLSAAVEELKDIGFAISISDLYSAARESVKAELVSMSPYIIIAFSLAVIGTASSVALMFYKEMKKFSVFYICGIPWKKIQGILPVYVLYLFIFSAAVYILICVVCDGLEILSYYDLMLTFKEMLVLALTYIILFSAAAAELKIVFKKAQPIDILYENTNK